MLPFWGPSTKRNKMTGQSPTIRPGRRRKKLPIAPPLWSQSWECTKRDTTLDLQDNDLGGYRGYRVKKKYISDLLCKNTITKKKYIGDLQSKNTFYSQKQLGTKKTTHWPHTLLAWFSAKEWKSSSTVLPCCCSNCLGLRGVHFFFGRKKTRKIREVRARCVFFDKGRILCKQKVVVTSSCLGFKSRRSPNSLRHAGLHAKDLKMSWAKKHV